MSWTDQYEHRWRQHVSEREATFVEAIQANPHATEAEQVLASMIVRLGKAVADEQEARWEERMGEDL